MKKYIYIVSCFLFSSFFFAQEIEKDSVQEKKFSVGISLGLESYSTKSFIAQSYDGVKSIRLDMTYPIKDYFGFGFLIEFKSPNIKSTEFVGETQSAMITELGAFATYYIPLSSTLSFTGMAGVSNFNLRNTIITNQKYHYRSTGYKIFVYPELNYKLGNAFSVFTQANLGYINFAVEANDDLNANYNTAFNYGGRLGLRFHY